MKKILAMLLLLAMCVSLFTACAKSETPDAPNADPAQTEQTQDNTKTDAPSENTEKPSTWLCDEPTKLYIYNNWGNTPTTDRDQEIHDRILEITNVDIVMPDCADYYNNRSVFLASDEPIDLMMESCWWATDLIGQGAYQIVDDLVDQYGVNFKASYDESMHSFVKWDGHYYGMGGSNYQSLYGIWANKTMLEENGYSLPTTIDEFNEIVYGLKEKNPDCIPLLANWQWLQRCFEASFSESYMDWYDTSENLLKPDFLMPGYTDFVKQVKAWYTDGILPDFVNPATYSNDLEQTAWMTGNVAFFCNNFANGPKNISNLHELYPDEEYVYIDCLAGKDGRKGFEPRPLIPYFYAVPTKSQNAELAIKFLDWAIGEEGFRLMNYGVEGEDYTINDKGERVTISDYTGCWTMASGVGEVLYALDPEGTDVSEGSAKWLYKTYGFTGTVAPQDTYGINMNLSSIPQELKDTESAEKTTVSEVLANYMWADGTDEDWEAAKAAYAEKNAEYMKQRTALYQAVLDANGLTLDDIHAMLGK